MNTGPDYCYLHIASGAGGTANPSLSKVSIPPAPPGYRCAGVRVMAGAFGSAGCSLQLWVYEQRAWPQGDVQTGIGPWGSWPSVRVALTTAVPPFNMYFGAPVTTPATLGISSSSALNATGWHIFAVYARDGNA